MKIILTVVRFLNRFSAVTGVALAIVALTESPGRAEEALVQPARSTGIQGLTLDFGKARFDSAKKRIRLTGRYVRPEWTLIHGNTVLVSDESRKTEFELEVDAPREGALLKLMAVSPTGETETGLYTIAGAAPDAPAETPNEAPAIAQLATDPSKHFPWGFGLSATRVNYAQDMTFAFSEWALTARAGYTHVFASQKWEMGLTGFGTLLPFAATSPAGFSSLALRFLGVNARVGHRFAQSKRGWAGSIQTGAYYTTTFSSGSAAFGFKNLAGPQIFPTITKLFASATSQTLLGAYFKFSPVAEDFRLLRTSNREIAVGLFWRKSLKNGHPFAIAFDWSNLKLSNATTSISVSTYGAGATYYF